MKHCLKQIVKAEIYNKQDQLVLTAYNDIENDDVTECPRAGLATGVGYELCKSICNQKGHAEVQAVNEGIRRGIDLRDCYLVLSGHTYICDECVSYMKAHGLSDWRIK